MKRKGPDCRLYFKAFLDRVAGEFKTEPPPNEIEEEARAAKIMRGLVNLQFHRSRLEAHRILNPFWSRYNWEVRGRTICVWLPIAIEGRQRGDWLGKNIDDPEALQSGEPERIQAIIDQKLVREKFVPLVENIAIPSDEQSQTWSNSGKTFETSLAEAVAEEKTRNIQQLRPAISVLGGKKLKQLILCIFEGIGDVEYEDMKVAREFGLSKATFSRFAGSRWLEGKTPPDLWRNTAKVLSTNPIFMEVTIETGFWKQVQDVLERGISSNGEEISHD